MSLRHHAPRIAKPALRPPAPAQPSPLVRAGTQTGGQALDRPLQTRMSARFGHDFSSIRIHTDSRAEESAQALGANAFAHGSDIVFGPGQYQPGSPDTERLLAHELTHVAQQAQWGPGDPTRTSRNSDASEREADSLAAQVVAGRDVQVQAAPQAGVARVSDATRDYGLNVGATAGSFLPGPLGMLFGAFGAEESIRGMPGEEDTPVKTMKQVEALAGFGNGALGTAAYFGGFDAIPALGGSAASVTGAGLEGAAALGPAALVAGAGLFGLATGHYLSENTEVGEDAQDSMGTMNGWLGGDKDHNAIDGFDEYKKAEWNRGGIGGKFHAIGAGIGEGAIATGAAVGGLAKGAYHGAEWAGGKVADGAEWAGGKVADGAEWAGGKVADGAEWAGGKVAGAASAMWDFFTGDDDDGKEQQENRDRDERVAKDLREANEWEEKHPVESQKFKADIQNYRNATPEERKAMPNAMEMEMVINPFGFGKSGDKDARH